MDEFNGERVQRDKGKRLGEKPLGIITFKDQAEEGNSAILLRSN